MQVAESFPFWEMLMFWGPIALCVGMIIGVVIVWARARAQRIRMAIVQANEALHSDPAAMDNGLDKSSDRVMRRYNRIAIGEDHATGVMLSELAIGQLTWWQTQMLDEHLMFCDDCMHLWIAEGGYVRTERTNKRE